jgi:hypothetical protein
LAAEELGICEEIRRIGDGFGHPGSILRARRKRVASRTFLARRQGWGSMGRRRYVSAMAAELGCCREFTGERGRASQK